MAKTRVQISVMNLGQINTGLVEFLNWLRENEKRYELDFENLLETHRRPIENNLNFIQKRFLKSQNDYLLILGDDIVPLKNPLDWIENAPDIISAAVPAWKRLDGRWELVWLAFRRKGGQYFIIPSSEQVGIKEVDAVGNCCLLVSRRVLEKVKPMAKFVFTREGLPKLSEDLNFCLRAKKKGFHVWVDWDLKCRHQVKADLMDIYETFFMEP